MESVRVCPPHGSFSSTWAALFGFSFGVYCILKLLGRHLRSKHTPVYVSYRLYASVSRVVPAVALMAGLTFVVDALHVERSLLTCGPWGVRQWLALLFHLCFMARLVLHWLLTYQAEMVATVVDVWLVGQAFLSLTLGVTLHTFTFLTLLRFFYPECRRVWARLEVWMQVCGELAVGVLLVAGALQVAEEFDTQYGLHPTLHGPLLPVRRFWEYVYWTVVTLSTVGYGEITPSTVAGQVVVVCAVVCAVVWFLAVAARVSAIRRAHVREGGYPSLMSSHPRMIVLGGAHPDTVKHLLTEVTKDQDSEVEVIVLVPEKKAEACGWVNTFLPAKLLVCTSLEEDLEKLLPNIENKKHKLARAQDTVVICGDLQASDPLQEDMQVLQVLHQVRQYVPDRRLVVQVMLSRTAHAVTSTPFWSPRDRVVCLEEICVELVSQAAVHRAAGPVLGGLLAPPAPPPQHPHDDAMLLLRNHGEHCNISFKETMIQGGTFEEVALELYRSKGELLLGWVSLDTQEVSLASRGLPEEGVAAWVVISNRSGKEVDLASVQERSTSGRRSSASRCYHLRSREVRVRVSQAGPGSSALRASLRRFPNVHEFSDSKGGAPCTVAATMAGLHLRDAINSYFIRSEAMRAHASSRKAKVRFVSDAMHGGEGKVRGHHSSSDTVNRLLVVSAVGTAVLSCREYDVWRKLISEPTTTEVTVSRECSYGRLLRALLLREALLPLGVRLSRYQDCTLTNPPPGVPLSPGDSMLCLQITDSPPSLPLPLPLPPPLPPPPVHSSPPSTHSLSPSTISLYPSTLSLSPSTHSLSPSTQSLSPSTHSLSPSTHSLHPSTHSLSPSTHSLHPSTLSLSPSTLSLHPSTLSLHPSTHSLHPSTHSMSPSTHSLHPSTHLLSPSTLSLHPSTFSLHPSTHSLSPSTLSLHPSTHSSPYPTHSSPSSTHLSPSSTYLSPSTHLSSPSAYLNSSPTHSPSPYAHSHSPPTHSSPPPTHSSPPTTHSSSSPTQSPLSSTHSPPSPTHSSTNTLSPHS